MKKCIALVLIALMLTCLAGIASAELKTVEVRDTYTYLCVGREQTYLPKYIDYSHQFGYIYDKDDFIITYETDHEGVTIAEDGTLHISADAATGQIVIRVTYAYKPWPANKKVNEYNSRIYLVEPPTKLLVDRELVVMNVGAYEEYVHINIPTGATLIESYTYDDAVVTAELKKDSISADFNYYLTIKPVAVGESYITLRAPNNIIKRIKVIVVKNATKMELSSDYYTCYVGETIDLGIDMGNGPYGVAAYSPDISVTENGKYINTYDFCTDDSKFYAARAGKFDINVTNHFHSAKAKVDVYDNAACTDIELANGDAQVDSATKVILRDAKGNVIFRPVSVSAGGELTAADAAWTVKFPEAGSYTITVKNPDGSTYAETFEAGAKPTELTLAASELTMQIGDVFDLNPTFDVEGDFICEYKIYDSGSETKYGMVCIRLESSKVIAQGPGEADVSVRQGSLVAYCRIVVEEGDAQISIVLSETPVGVGKTAQATVQDKTGKVYPATFSARSGGVNVTENGQVTGVHSGDFRMTANLEDGRTLEGSGKVVVYPEWLQYSNVVLTMDEQKDIVSVLTDKGYVDKSHVIFSIDDTSICKMANGEFWPVSPGTTTATVTSRYNGVSATFLIEVIDDSVLYAGSTSIRVPYGFMAYLPTVTNSSGEEIRVKWKITQDTPGEGNPEDSAFVLEGDTITCVWPRGSCIVTGTAGNKATVKVNIYAYMLPESISLTPTVVELEPGDTVTLKVAWEDSFAHVDKVYWAAETEGILSYDKTSTSTKKSFSARKAGQTFVVAMLDNGVYAVTLVNVTDPHARKPGDANEDGVIDAKDALLVMQYDAGWNVSINGYAGDVNADGKTDLADAVLIFQYSAGLDVELKQYIPQ